MNISTKEDLLKKYRTVCGQEVELQRICIGLAVQYVTGRVLPQGGRPGSEMFWGLDGRFSTRVGVTSDADLVEVLTYE